MRAISRLTSNGLLAFRVYRNTDWDEFVTRFYRWHFERQRWQHLENSDNHTTDRDDAFATGRFEIGLPSERQQVTFDVGWIAADGSGLQRCEMTAHGLTELANSNRADGWIVINSLYA